MVVNKNSWQFYYEYFENILSYMKYFTFVTASYTLFILNIDDARTNAIFQFSDGSVDVYTNCYK